MKKETTMRRRFLTVNAKLLLMAALFGLIHLTGFATETTYLYTFDDEISGACDSSATDTGTPGSTNATLTNYSNALWEYITGYSCNCLKYGTDVSADAKMSISNVTWGQKFILESKIYKGNESTGVIDLAKHSANSNFRWYIDNDGKMRLSLNGGTDFNVSTSGSVLSNEQWTRLYTVVDLSQSTLSNAVKMYRYVDDATGNENYFGSGADGDLTVSGNTTWNSGPSGDMMVKNFNNFTVNSGVTLTIKARKGCMIYVKGNFTNNGTIEVQSGYECDPVSAGVPSGGLKIIRFKSGSTETLSASDLSGCGTTATTAEANQQAISGNGKIYTISRTGASGGASVSYDGNNYRNGNVGSNGGTLQSAGGGSGAEAGGGTSGSGGNGTCFSGGAGGGGCISGTATSGSSTGGAGGNGQASGGAVYCGHGGAGNPAGTNQKVNGGTFGNDAESRSGGLLILLVHGNFTVGASGIITAKGGTGGGYGASGFSYVSGGGGSGGGIILGLYAGEYSNSGSINATGGIGGDVSGTYPGDGGAGGTGSVLIEQIDGFSSSCSLTGTFQGAFAFGTGAVATTANDVDMLKRDSASFSLKTDFIKLTTDAAAATISNALANFYQSNTSYVKTGSSSAIQLTPSSLIRRVTNPPTDFTAAGLLNSGASASYDTHPTTPSVFHGIFEINFKLDTASFSGNVTVDIYIQKPGESFKKIGEVNTTKPASGDWNVVYYWNSRAAAYDWTSTDAQAYRTDGLVRFKFSVR